MKIGLQLHTIRDSHQNKEEFIELLRKVKELGYEGVEFAGFSELYGLKAEEIKNLLQEIGLVPIAGHYMLDDLDNRLEETLDFARKVGIKTIVCAYASTSNAEEVEYLQKVLTKAQSRIKAYDMELIYHNHSHEFVNIEDGSIPIVTVMQLCKLEVDTYWVFHAGAEPCSFLKESADQISLIHLKDGDLEGHPCAIGEGYNNIKGIIQASRNIGMEWLIVEDDNPTPDGISDVSRSIQNLKPMLG